MTTINLYRATDINSVFLDHGFPTHAAATAKTQFVLTLGTEVDTYHGSGFTYGAFGGISQAITGGTVTAAEFRDHGALVLSASGGSLSAVTMRNDIVANNGTGLAAYVLAGNDSITGSSGNDTIFGYNGNDTIVGGAGNDSIVGGSGNDVLNGGAGADHISGGIGNDVYAVDNAGDVLTENVGEGTDIVQSMVTYTLAANLENLTLMGTAAINGTGNALSNILTGNAAANTLSGMDGNDTINGGAGIDHMNGGTGNDTYIVDNGGDVVTEQSGEGTDTVQTAITYMLQANLENLTLTGTGAISGTGNLQDNVLMGNAAGNILSGLAGNDILGGAAGNDTLYGADDNDSIYGGDGNDFIYGERGNDSLIGGAGNDTFYFQATPGNDIITDFTGAGATGGDIIHIAPHIDGTNIMNFTTLAATHITYDLANHQAFIDLGMGSTLTVVGVTHTFIATDFVIG